MAKSHQLEGQNLEAHEKCCNFAVLKVITQQSGKLS